MSGGKIFDKRSGIVIATAFLSLVVFSSIFENIEWRFYDYRVQLANLLFQDEIATADRVVIVGIDGVESLRDKPLIFWYPQIGEAIQLAAAAGASAVGIDLIPYHSLGEKLDLVTTEFYSKGASEEDEGFDDDFDDEGFDDDDEEEQGEGAGLDNIGGDLDRSIIAALMRSSMTIPVLQGYNGDIVPFYYGLLAHMPGVSPASLAIDYDDDKVLRHSFATDEDGSPRLAAAICAATGLCQSEASFLVNFSLIDKVSTIDFNDFITQQPTEGALEGKIVLLGMVNGNEDLVHTPLGLRSGIYFHGATIDTMLTGSAPRVADNVLSWMVLFGLCVAGYLVSARFSPVVASAGLTVLTVLYCVVNLYFFAKGHVLPAFPHLFAPGLMAAVTYPYRYLVEERDRKKLMETFSYYVDKSVIDRLVGTDAKRLMEGEQRQVTVMSLDIRNFTSLSNSFPPETVVDLLNYLFSHFTELVQGCEGFVNKFMGDGMLAFFPGDAGPINALDCAEKLVTVVERMNDSNELAPFIQSRSIGIGIGLHHGPVILGNIGSRRKMDFTVIGPTVNLAFRIESVTKELKQIVLVTHEVYEQGKDLYDFEPLGSVEVKGFEGGIRVYTPRGRIDHQPQTE